MSDGPTHDETLREARDRFVALWGQMGSTWGIPRTMAQVHALLFISGAPMHAEEVMEGLGISRGNASMTLRRLVDWGIVSREHRRGDRKEYFVAEQDVWKMFRTIIAQRKKREVDPLLDALAECRETTEVSPERKLDAGAAEVRAHNQRLDELISFMRMVDSISGRFTGPTGKGLEMAAKLLDRGVVIDHRSIIRSVIEVRWTATLARSAAPNGVACNGGFRQTLVVTLRAMDDEHVLLEAWLETHAGARPIFPRRPVTGSVLRDGDLTHVDVAHDGRPLLNLTLAGAPADLERPLYARTPLLARAGLSPGGFDPPRVRLIASEGAATG